MDRNAYIHMKYISEEMYLHLDKICKFQAKHFYVFLQKVLHPIFLDLDKIYCEMNELPSLTESGYNIRDGRTSMAFCNGFSSIIESSGEEVPAAEPSGSYEGESSHSWGEEQTFCLPCGGEESWSNSKMGREIQGIYWQLLRTFWTRWDVGKRLNAAIK